MREILFEETGRIDLIWVGATALLIFPSAIMAITLFQSTSTLFYFKATVFAFLATITAAVVLFFTARKIKLRSDELVIQCGPVITAIKLKDITEVHELPGKNHPTLKEQLVLISSFDKQPNIKILQTDCGQIKNTNFYCQNPKKLISAMKKLAGPTGFEPATP